MNHIYRLVWNEEHQDCVPAPETARRRGKRGSKKAGKVFQAAASVLLGLFLAQPGFAQPIGPNTLPTGGEVIHGQANISQNGNQMHIHQGSDKAILHWQGFDIGRDAQVDFAQPSTSSVALNRVVAGDASQIHGQLTANGQVWLVNPKGVVFGQGSRVDVGGLVATTLDTTNEDFLAGKMNFSRNEATGSITNQGEITAAEGGLVALLAPEIINDGLVSAQMGNVVMAGGDRVSLDAGMNGMLKVAVDASTVDSLIENRQMVKADGGQVIMTSKAATELVSSVITNKGTVQARTMVEKDGRILLLADMDHGEVHQAGILDASAQVSGDGGFIETSAATVKVADGSKVTTRAETGQSGTWLIDPQDFTIAKEGGDITGDELTEILKNNGRTIVSTEGFSEGNGDIHVNDAVNWSANTLSLTADRDININAKMTATDTAQLEMTADNDININAVMTFSDDTKLEMNTGTGDVKVGFKEGEDQGFAGRVDFGTRTGTGFLTINSQDYTVINALGNQGSVTKADLQGMQGDLDGHYALGANIDTSDTENWNGGFTPIGTSSIFFEGTFNGLGHVIDGLTINRSDQDYVGLFGYTRDSKISNVGLEAVSITGQENVGGLVGRNGYTAAGYDQPGQISNSYVTGVVTGEKEVGGLVGQSQPGHISSSYATGVVTGTGDRVGGLVGKNAKGQITQSYAKSEVEGKKEVGGLVGIGDNNSDITESHATGQVEGTGDEVGGLVGSNTGSSTISESYATGTVTSTGNEVGGLAGNNLSSSSITHSNAIEGKVTGNKRVGGLVGENKYKITNSYATGKVKGNNKVGGLVGLNTSEIKTSYATGLVTGTGDNVGGLVGENDQKISTSYATGTVTSTGDNVGGLVGNNDDDAQISNSYAQGDVKGNNKVGGLVGSNDFGGEITDSYAIGLVTGTGSDVGGLVGSFVAGTVVNCFWDTEKSKIETSAGDTGVSGKTTAQMKTKDTFTDWSISNQGGDGKIWRIYEGDSYPLLRSFFMTSYDLTGVTVNDDSKTYSGIAYFGGKDLSDFTGDMDHVFYGGNAQGAINAGTYTISIYSDQQGYDFISNPTGTLTIDKAPLTITANDASKTYDGQAYSGGNGVTYAGFVNNEDEGVLDDSLTYDGSSQGAIDAGTYIITPKGLTSTNYAISFFDGTLTIKRAPIEYITIYGRLTGTVQKTYDGTTEATLAPENYVLTGWVAGQGAQVTKTKGSYDNANVGTGKLVTVSLTNADYAPTGTTNLGNYDLPTSISGNVGVIDPASLTVTANDAAKTYDGLAYSGGNGVIYSGFVAGETASVLDGALTYSGSSQGARDVGSYAITPGGYTSTNYILTYVDGTLTISPAALTAILGRLTGTVQKTYDGTIVATLAPDNYVLTGWQNDDGAQVTKTSGSYDHANAGTGKMVTASLTNADYAPTGSTDLGNYDLPTSISGNVGVIDPASLTVTANDAAKTYDGLAYSGGNGVSYSGFVADETAGVLDGTLTYGGTSQGARNAGKYSITPGGYTSTNYILDYVDGQLVIRVRPAQPSGGTLWMVEEMQKNSGPQEADSFNRGQARPLLSFAPHFIRLNDEEEEEQEL